MYALSRFANVTLKFHGLGEFCERNVPMTNPNPFEGQVGPILAMALDAFGPRRMMWGSDWPPVSRREGYGNALNLTRDYLRERCSEDVLAAMFGGTALKVYQFS